MTGAPTSEPATGAPFLDETHWRGLLHQTTGDDALVEHLQAGGRVAYAGFDPTSDSLHIGNFIPIQLLRLWQQAGHKPIVLMGGGTGLIGDPSGKDSERSLLTREQVEANVEGQRRIFERLLDFDPANPNAAVIVNNVDWLEPLGYIEVLRDVGKHFSVNEMIKRDSVRTRLETREQGISYTELSYMILQGYDFLHLRRAMNCTVQLAGADQFGNIVSGIDLIRRDLGSEEAHAYAITAPLITRSDGKKMGKSESGAIWMTADRTSPYAFYQYWLNVVDDDAVRFLGLFTDLDRDAIEAVRVEHAARPHERNAQRALATYMTDLLHGDDERKRAETASNALFTGNVSALDDGLLQEVFAGVASSTHARTTLEGEGASLVDVLVETALAKSRREARQYLGDGAVSINGDRVEGDALMRRLSCSDLLHGRTILLRRGKKQWHALRFE